MTRIISTFFFIFIASCVSMEAMGQDFQSIRQKAENAVKTKRPDLTLISKDEGEKQAVYNWKALHEGIRVLIFYGTSHEEAVEKMETTIKFLSVGPGEKRKDIGDEAYSWISGRGDFAGIRFRKANVYIEVTAPTMVMAEDLARSLAQKIRKK